MLARYAMCAHQGTIDPTKSHLIKAIQHFERLNIDFKGPHASSDKNIHFINVIDG